MSDVGTNTAQYAYSSDRCCMRRRKIRIPLPTHTAQIGAICGGYV